MRTFRRYIKNFLGMTIWIGFFCAILFLSIKHHPIKPDRSKDFAPAFEDDFDCCTSEQEKKELEQTRKRTLHQYYVRMTKGN